MSRFDPSDGRSDPSRKEGRDRELRDAPSRDSRHSRRRVPPPSLRLDKTGAALLRGPSSARGGRNPSRKTSPGRPRSLDPIRPLVDRSVARDVPIPGRRLRLSHEQISCLRDVSAFRSCSLSDLQRSWNPQDIDRLERAGFISKVQRNGDPNSYYVPTRDGSRFAVSTRDDSLQQYHAGPKRLRDIRHDSSVYSAYLREKADIESKGGRVLRTRIEDDLRRNFNKEKAFLESKRSLNDDDLRSLSEDNHIVFQDDKVHYPDLQIELERPGGDIAHANIEIVTEHYHAASVASKSAAGFSLYLASGSSGTRDSGGRGAISPVKSLADDLLDI